MKALATVIGILLTICAEAQNQQGPAVAPKILFQRLDKNGDGRLTPDEIPRRQLLPRVDRDGNGSVSLDELKDFQASRGPDTKPVPKHKGPFAAASDYLARHNGHALLIYHRDELIHEGYFNGWSADKPHRLASGTKSFSGIMAIAATEDGLLDLDEPVARTITEWRDEPRKAKITIRQLLSLTSGLAGGEIGSVPSYAVALNTAEARFRPGSRFQYGPVPFQVFGEIMRRKLKPSNRSVEQYVHERIFEPIGLRVASWRKDRDGNVRLPSGITITAREWAKFGLFVLHHGLWNGQRVLPRKALSACFKGSSANSNYGLTFWLGDKGSGLDDLVMAAGAGKQKLFIVPSRQMLIVQFAEATRSYKELELLQLVLADVPAE